MSPISKPNKSPSKLSQLDSGGQNPKGANNNKCHIANKDDDSDSDDEVQIIEVKTPSREQVKAKTKPDSNQGDDNGNENNLLGESPRKSQEFDQPLQDGIIGMKVRSPQNVGQRGKLFE